MPLLSSYTQATSDGIYGTFAISAAYVPAGEFDAFKVDARDSRISRQGGTGESHFVYSYAPARVPM